MFHLRTKPLPAVRRSPARGIPAMTVQLSPEPDPTARTAELRQGQTTGPLPLGFDFELVGLRYTWFELSADGFMTFGPDPSIYRTVWHGSGRFIPMYPELGNFIALGLADPLPGNRRRIAYEVRGAPQRRRLVLSVTEVPHRAGPGRNVQVILHERTGMIDIRFKDAA
jgi:hypothetical protein